MSAPRREARRTDFTELRAQAIQLGNEWLSHALSTEPADRDAAENAIASVYALVNEPPPRFVWVKSPQEAARILPSAPPPAPVVPPWSLESRIATVIHEARESMARKVPVPRRFQRRRPDGDPLTTFTDAYVYGRLNTTVRESVADILRNELAMRMGLYWYGQQEADWIAHFDVQRRLGTVHFRRADAMRLDLFAAIAKSSGWWWPRDGTCIIAERPLVIHTENVDDEAGLRLHNDSGPAIAYPDGWSLYSWHGTQIPRWVIDDPTAARIAEEPNIEVRRCAIERIGWAEFIDQAGLALISSAPDPANPGAELRLYDLPYRNWGKQTRLLLAINGSRERDGTRRQYGLRVPPWFTNPVDAAAWSYGLTGSQYAQLQRRT